ncbi:hypothetical protein B296_00008606 [Ensete ventricosum]|uniref:Uncharacterized protein n=1 Tax=Ensete ventricosum TaxID=4639 RepID=A0A427AJI8_ENSVE|nr:hypothetical protein B296_00008606 [Ensete ventricosum]
MATARDEGGNYNLGFLDGNMWQYQGVGKGGCNLVLDGNNNSSKVWKTADSDDSKGRKEERSEDNIDGVIGSNVSSKVGRDNSGGEEWQTMASGRKWRDASDRSIVDGGSGRWLWNHRTVRSIPFFVVFLIAKTSANISLSMLADDLLLRHRSRTPRLSVTGQNNLRELEAVAFPCLLSSLTEQQRREETIGSRRKDPMTVRKIDVDLVLVRQLGAYEGVDDSGPLEQNLQDLEIRSQSSREVERAASATRALWSVMLEDVLRAKEEQQIWWKMAPTKAASGISSNYTDGCGGRGGGGGGGERKGAPTSSCIHMQISLAAYDNAVI